MTYTYFYYILIPILLNRVGLLSNKQILEAAMGNRRCTEGFIVYTFLGAVCQLLSTASPLDFGPGTAKPAVRFTLSEVGTQGQCQGEVQLVSLDEEFAVLLMESAGVTSNTFTPALHQVLGREEVDRTIVEMAALPGTVCYRLSRALFSEMTTVQTN